MVWMCVMQKSTMDIHRWVSLVLVSLRVILTQSKEEVVLGRLQQLGLTISLFDAGDGVDTDCAHEPAVAESTSPDMMFAKYVIVAILLIHLAFSCLFYLFQYQTIMT